MDGWGILCNVYIGLVCLNRSVLAPYFNEIYLLPESPVLTDVVEVLKKHVEAPRRYIVLYHYDLEVILLFYYSLREQFRHLLKGVLHERPDVRLHALKALHKLLKSNRVCILLPLAVDKTICSYIHRQNYKTIWWTVIQLIQSLLKL